jgi:hypothetical protein
MARLFVLSDALLNGSGIGQFPEMETTFGSDASALTFSSNG